MAVKGLLERDKMLKCKIVMFSTMKMEPLSPLTIDGQEMMDYSLAEILLHPLLLGFVPNLSIF